MKKDRFFSPGRINIIGEHIDYNGGHVLPCAIDIGTYGDVSEIDEKKIILYSKNFKEVGELEISLGDSYEKSGDWSDYVKGVLDVLAKKGYKVEKGLRVEVEGNIPNASGLSSSASLEVLFIYIFDYYNNFNIKREDMAVYAKEAENNFVGVQCGIMDQFIVANGRDSMALLLDCETLEYEHYPCELGEYIVAVMDTKKKRGLVDSAYNERRTQCEKGLEKLKRVVDAKNLCDIDPKVVESHKELLTLNEYKRAKHATTEEKRVKEGVEALKNGDIKKLGEKIYETHNSLRDDFEVSCKELDIYVELSKKYGSIGARMTGAGFGGCAIALIKESEKEHFKKEVLKEYKEKAGLDGDIYFVKIGNGVGKL